MHDQAQPQKIMLDIVSSNYAHPGRMSRYTAEAANFEIEQGALFVTNFRVTNTSNVREKLALTNTLAHKIVLSQRRHNLVVSSTIGHCH